MPVISDLQLTITPATGLYTNPIPDTEITASETQAGSRSAIVLDFNSGDGLYARDLGCTFQAPMSSGTILYVWQPSVLAQPETIYDRGSDWDDGGTPGDKFIQGCMIEANSFNTAKTFFLEDSDTLTLHPLNECPATFNGQSEIAFSCAPFTAHSCRVISTDGVAWQVFNSRLVFEPWPEACLNWQTEMTSLGMIGWAHAREANIAYLSNAPVNLVLTFDAWPAIALTLPNSNGLQSKLKVTLPANKWKLIGLQASSASATLPFRLWASDMQLKIKTWGSTEAYQIVKPFGGQGKAGATV